MIACRGRGAKEITYWRVCVVTPARCCHRGYVVEGREGERWQSGGRIGTEDPLSRGSGQPRSLNIQPFAGRERPTAAAPPERGHESTVPSFAPSPAELFDRGQRSAGGRKSSSPREGSARSSGGSAFFSHIFCCRPEFHPFFSHSIFLTPSGVAVRARWRAKKSSSFTLRRQSLGNGKASASSSGTPKRDNSWAALALVGVSFFLTAI